LAANWSTLLPGIEPPTARIETDAALALIVFFAVIYFGIRARGLVGYLKTFAEPTFVMIPLNLVETFTRTFSLIVRLFGNVMSGVFVVGIVLSLVVIIASRTYFGNEAFNAWAWRIPFLFSFLLMAIAWYIRVHFQESPIFEEIKAKGAMTKNPWKEAFLSQNIKYVLIATIVVLGEGVVWYSGQFWPLYYLGTVVKLDTLTTAYIVGGGLVIGTPTLILFGWLSDHIGRKPVILAGFLLAALTYYPLFKWLGAVAQPGNVNYPVAILIIAIMVAYVGMVYGPIGAFLAEYFPGRIRYTSVSVPYHIGNGWGGGLVPFITTAAYTATGSLAYALIYPIAVPAVAFVLSLFLMPETRERSIWEEAATTQKA